MDAGIPPVVGFFGDGWSWIVDAANSAWQNYLQPVFDAIGIVVTWLWENIISPYFNFILGLWMSLGEVFMLVWQNVLSPRSEERRVGKECRSQVWPYE